MAQLDTDMGERVCKAMWDMGIDVQTDQPVREIEVDADGAARAVRTDAGSYDADLVVLGLGMGPEVALAREAGCRSARPARSTSPAPSAAARTRRSSPPGTARRPSTGSPARPAHVALGTHANKQGRVAGSVIGGRPGPLRRRPRDRDDQGR
jgi:NADPH-dependent 2,4-dienoyl-CoA reductase/sulfur reductase-like enzyme